MGRAPLLFAALPDGQVRIHDVYVCPTEPGAKDYQTGLIETINIFSDSEQARRYHRQEFESGHFWQQHRNRFNPKNRADYTLLENLKVMRRKLIQLLIEQTSLDIASEITHRLLGRAIFIKYLEDRKDLSGRNVFPEDYFGHSANCFIDVLPDKEATYRLFQELNRKFNGDLFPILPDEQKYVKEDHFEWLQRFLKGHEKFSEGGQLHLWKFYSFDVIPIEFISKIYEEFFHIHKEEKDKKRKGSKSQKRTGTHYTPHYLVEFLVDEVFPWQGTSINLKTLDPACGSGIFLVEVYRRLIAHWQQANSGQSIEFKHLKQLLVQNIFGVDIDGGAIHVAAFSLYLTLCDFLEPRQIWKDVTFPPLRKRNLFQSDFFKKAHPFAANSDYDLIIGNPPWESNLSDDA